MPAFRQVGEKQLPNPILCMSWSPKRDLIALANTTGEVGMHTFFYFKTLTPFMLFLIPYLYLFFSYCSIVWLASSVFGAYLPLSAQGRRYQHSPGDLMEKVSNC